MVFKASPRALIMQLGSIQMSLKGIKRTSKIAKRIVLMLLLFPCGGIFHCRTLLLGKGFFFTAFLSFLCVHNFILEFVLLFCSE